MPLVRQNNTWAQAVGKCLNNSSEYGSANSTPPDIDSEQEISASTVSKMLRMEENSFQTHVAAAFSEGWGQMGVNQDTAWETEASPHLSPKDTNTWTSSNSGTEIWENNARHHVKNSANKPASQMREPWGHTPSNNIGGIWGEEEDNTNTWTGVPQQGGAQWREGNQVWGPNSADGAKNWNQGNPINANMNPNWNNEPPALPMGLPHMPMVNEKSVSEESSDHGPPWLNSPKNNHSLVGVSNWSQVTSGINKNNPSGWDESTQQANKGQTGTGFDNGTANWGNPVHQGKVCHWKEMPPPKTMPGHMMPPANFNQAGMIRLPQSATNKIDTASWVKNQPLNSNLPWNEIRDPSGQVWDNSLAEKVMLGPPPPITNDAFTTWGDADHGVGPNWAGKPKTQSWADGQVDTSNWGGPMKQTGKPLSKDLIWASTQFKLLSKLNFKKEDIENALRRKNMNLEEAFAELHASNPDFAKNINQPRGIMGNVGDDLGFPDHGIDNTLPPGNLYGNSNVPGMNMFSTGGGFNVPQNVKKQHSVGSNVGTPLGNSGTNNQLPNFGLNNGSGNINPALMQKMLQTQGFNPATLPQNAGRVNQQQNMINLQLRYLVQQIKQACVAGYLNPSILTQPLAPQTLRLLFQILHQIRFLHQIQLEQHRNKPNATHMNLLAHTKQSILDLQNCINAQQAAFIKQQQVQMSMPHPSLQTPQPSTFDVVKSEFDTMNGLHSEFRDLSLKDSNAQGHSRLTQWTLSSFDKDDNPADSSVRSNEDDFSRAPGSIAKPPSNLPPTNPPSSLQDNTWSDKVRQGDAWFDPNDANHSNSKDSSAIPTSQSYNLNDLVPEFEPGKPWKGSSRIKNFEDDPHVTPGSIAKSPLSLNSIKDTDIFWNPQQSNLTSSSLTSNTWNFSPPPSSSQNSDISSARSGQSWQSNCPPDQDSPMTWKGQPPMPKTSRAPPGLNNQSKNNSTPFMPTESGWSDAGWEKQSGSNFLVLKNLTPQIDGSTLKTLCLQHGPLQLFHLLLNHGIAVVQYSTRDESEKARSALNNCVLSNTTILVDIPTDTEIKQYLQLVSGQVSSSPGQIPAGQTSGQVPWSSGTDGNQESNFQNPGSGGNGNSGGATGNLGANWNGSSLNLQGSHIWSFSGSGNSNMWGAVQPTGAESDPSSLNSFLPGDLLGSGESI